MGDFSIYIRTDEERQKLLALVKEIKGLTRSFLLLKMNVEIKNINRKILTADVIIKALEYYLLYLKQNGNK